MESVNGSFKLYLPEFGEETVNGPVYLLKLDSFGKE